MFLKSLTTRHDLEQMFLMAEDSENAGSYRGRSEDLEYGWRLYFRESLSPRQVSATSSPADNHACGGISNDANNNGQCEEYIESAPTSPPCPSIHCEIGPVESSINKQYSPAEFTAERSLASDDPAAAAAAAAAVQSLSPAASRRERIMRSHAFASLKCHYLEVNPSQSRPPLNPPESERMNVKTDKRHKLTCTTAKGETLPSASPSVHPSSLAAPPSRPPIARCLQDGLLDGEATTLAILELEEAAGARETAIQSEKGE